MEIKLNLKQLVFVSIWILLLIVALLLSTTRPYVDLQGKAETFGELLFIFSGSLILFVLGYNFLQNDQDQEKT